jgi:4-amino-4-deoxy-L-arabinose transferase-like glycosyltransferase
VRRPLILIVGVACAWLYLAGLADVPFHPDEASWIYMSGDVDALAREGPSPLVWKRSEGMTTDVYMRLLNAPIAKYAIGAGRWLTGHSTDRNTDWQWWASWDENAAAGAVPPTAVLLVGRRTVALAAVLSLALLFQLTRSMYGVTAAIGATALLATHPLVMLHARRAMAEGIAQLFTVTAVVAMVRFARTADRSEGRNAVLRTAIVAGVAIGVAVASKQSAAALAAVAFATVVLVARSSHKEWRGRVGIGVEALAALTIAAGLTYFVLNPVLYEQPYRAGRAMISRRMEFARNQARGTEAITPRAVMPTVPSRLSAAWRQVCWNAPSFSEWPNYDDRIAPAVAAYEHTPMARVWNSTGVRVLFLLLSGVGIAGAAADVGRDRVGRRSRPQQIILVWLIAEIAFVATVFTLDWQRYFLPLLPPVCVLAGFGITKLSRLTRFCITSVT